MSPKCLLKARAACLVAQMRQRCRPLRKHRHQRSTGSNNLGFDLGQGRFGGYEIRLIAGIDNGFSFPRRSPPEPHETQHSRNAASSRDRRSILPHKVDGLSRNGFLLSSMARKLRNPTLRTLPDAHRISARPNSAPPTATRANDVVEMQPQRPRPLAARRASKPRPRAAVRKLPQMDADVLLDVAELDEERRRLGRDDVQRPQAARSHGRQIIAVFRYHRHV